MTSEAKPQSAYNELKSLEISDEAALKAKAYPWSPDGPPSEDIIRESMKKYTAYRELWDRCGSEKLKTAFPTNVDIELSSFCNLRCKMCNWGFDPKTNPSPEDYKKYQAFKNEAGSISPTFFKQLIDEIAHEGGPAIKVNWRGEPLMNKAAPELIRYAKERGITEVLMNTNGTLLSPDVCKRIVESGLDQIIFSIDSLNKETYESIRVGANLETTLANIFSFIKIRNKNKEKTGNPKPLIKVQMVLMDENKHEKELFEKLFAPMVDMISTQDYTNRGEQEDRLSGDENKPSGRRACPQIWQRLVVTWDGTAALCCRDWDKYHSLGKVEYPGTTIKDIWNSEALNEIRTIHKTEQLSELNACKRCTYKESFRWTVDQT